MATIHDEIDNYLAADLHNELSDDERSALHTHLVECADCRKLHQETKIMNKVLEENLANEKPDPTFEQRMLSGFRTRIPQKTRGLTQLIIDLMRLRATQITAVAALLLALMQVGRLVTGEQPAALTSLRQESFGGSRLKSPKKAQASGGIASAPTAPAGLPETAFEWPLNEAKSDKYHDAIRQFPASAQIASGAILPRALPVARDQKDRVAGTGANIPTADQMSPNPFGTSGPLGGGVLTASGRSKQRMPTSPKMELAAEPRFDNQTETAPMEADAESPETPTPQLANRKLIRNATVDLEIASFDEAVQKITRFAGEEKGYVATTNSEKQANGKLKGEVVVKVAPENLDRFLQKIRALGELKNQTLGTDDVTKAYFDTEARLKNSRVMEQRLIEMVKTKTGKVADLLEVERELGRVRGQIEQMQGELKLWDSQVQFATVTIQLAEKDLEEPAAFLLKEHAQLALYTAEVEKIYNDIKALASTKVQITNAQLDRNNAGHVSARIGVLIAPEESDAVIATVKSMGRVENFQVQSERVAQGGQGMSESAKTKRDKVELNITISRDEQEQSFQQTSLRILTGEVDAKTKTLRDLAEKQGGRVRTSTFSRDPDGHEFANIGLRVPMKNYNALMQSLGSLGKVENVSVQRQDNSGGQIDEANAPADLSIQIYTQGNIVSHDSGIFATLRRTLAQSAGAIMWSLRMIGVAVAFVAPWIAALAAVIWIVKRVIRARRNKP